MATDAELMQVINAPVTYDEYFIGLSSGESVAPKELQLTPEQLSKRIFKTFEEAAKSDNTPLDSVLNALKIGQTLYKTMPEPPFWAAGYARHIPTRVKQDKDRT